MIVRKGARLGSIRHDRVDPERSPNPVTAPDPEPESQLQRAVDPEPVIEPDPDPEPAVGLEQLRSDASELGVTVDRRWGAARLQQEIDKRLEDSDADDDGDA